MTCSHKFVDSNVCLKCGVSFAELKARDNAELAALLVNPNSPVRPSVKQLVDLQNHLTGMLETSIGQTLQREDIALISWALGIATGYCDLHDALDRVDAKREVPRQIAEGWTLTPRRRDQPRPDEELEVTWTSRSLHQALDMLMAEHIRETGERPSKTSVLALLEWSHARLERKEGG